MKGAFGNEGALPLWKRQIWKPGNQETRREENSAAGPKKTSWLPGFQI
jgi:hypothetical protein